MVNKILINRKQGQLKKMSVAIASILLLTMLLVTAQNILETPETQEQVTDDMEVEITEIQENADLQNDEFETINAEENMGTELDELETIIMEEGIEITSGETENSEEVEEESEQNATEETSDYTEINDSEQEVNETNESSDNENEENNITEPAENETIQPERNETIPPLTGEVTETEIPQLEIQLIHPNKITRGEEIEVKAIVTNFGGAAGDVLITWDLPFGFEIISGDKIADCGNLDNGETCNFSIDVRSSVSTSPGINEIKIKGNYKNGI